jgi:hypothetical protein
MNIDKYLSEQGFTKKSAYTVLDGWTLDEACELVGLSYNVDNGMMYSEEIEELGASLVDWFMEEEGCEMDDADLWIRTQLDEEE